MVSILLVKNAEMFSSMGRHLVVICRVNTLDNLQLLTKKSKDEKKESAFYTPSAKDGKDKVYVSKIKFLPNIFNTKNSLINKYVTYLENLDSEEKKMLYML